MNRILRNVFYFLTFSNVTISLAALAQCALTYVILDQHFDYHVIYLETAATLLLYNFTIWLAKPTIPSQSPFARTRWIFKYEWLLWTNNFLALAVAIYCMLHLSLATLFFFTGIGILSALYAIPLFKVNGRREGLRHIAGIKVFYIALIWTLSSVGLPVVEMLAQGFKVPWSIVYYLTGMKFIFMLLLTIPFDIRDMQQDSIYKLRTIPTLIGRPYAVLLCYALLVLHTILLFFAPYRTFVQLGLVTTNISIGLLFYFLIFRQTHRYHFVYLLDIALIFQFIAVALCAI